MPQDTNTPPAGDPQKAERYLNTLVDLIKADKLQVNRSDLKKYDPTSLQDHYRLSLEDYDVEISHSKQPESGRDLYIMLFTNSQQGQPEPSQKIILAYVYLVKEQFTKFKEVAEDQISQKIKDQQDSRFKEAMSPIDAILEKLLSQQFASDNLPITPTEIPLDQVKPTISNGLAAGQTQPIADNTLRESELLSVTPAPTQSFTPPPAQPTIVEKPSSLPTEEPATAPSVPEPIVNQPPTPWASISDIPKISNGFGSPPPTFRPQATTQPPIGQAPLTPVAQPESAPVQPPPKPAIVMEPQTANLNPPVSNSPFITVDPMEGQISQGNYQAVSQPPPEQTTNLNPPQAII